MRAFALWLALLPLPGPAPQAAPGCATDAMLVFDGSGSMAELGHDPTAATRIAEARAALRRAMPEIAPYRRIGLMTYGAGGNHPCSGITRHFAPIPDAGAAVVAGIEALVPGGLTPIADSVAAAADVLEYRTRAGIVVLVTDGNETCGGTPCALGAALAEAARDLTVHVIGFRVVHDPFSWNSPEAQTYDGQTVAKCLADATGGMFVSTETVDELAAALRETLGCPLIGWQEGVAPPRGRG
ncbi:vWA domain-containing protein [Roseovarius sp.]|uniref:vWA domain-containing protein n=1 Tax=Roseovarius sp. TaxID=1486281 RepID=UPI003A98267B